MFQTIHFVLCHLGSGRPLLLFGILQVCFREMKQVINLQGGLKEGETEVRETY